MHKQQSNRYYDTHYKVTVIVTHMTGLMLLLLLLQLLLQIQPASTC
jgi:hypothetical protein